MPLDSARFLGDLVEETRLDHGARMELTEN